MLIGDTETNGLMPDVSVIHCAVFYDIPTGTWTEFTPDTVHLIPEFLDSQPKLCMHNGIGFDFQVYEKLLNYKYSGKKRDSLLMSRVLWPDKAKNFYMKDGKQVFSKGGPHSVENWAIQFKMFKPVHEDWSVFSPEMLHRCKEDVKIQTKLYLYIEKYTTMLLSGDKRIKTFDNIWDMEQRVWEIIEQQSRNGWTLDINKAYNFVDELDKMLNDIDNKLIPSLPIKFVSPTKTDNKTVKAFVDKGGISSAAYKWIGQENINKLEGDFCKVVKQEINLNSPTQVKDYLLSLGWVPNKYNFKKDKFNKPVRDDKRKLIYTTPKIPDTIEEWELLAKKLKHPTLDLMADRGKVKHRLGAIKGYIDNVSPDGRLRGSVDTCSANTTRMTHKVIVNVPKASDSMFYGKQMRGLFIASKNKVMVGCDASALEARVEAHYIYLDDPASSMELIEGDIHLRNVIIFNLLKKDIKNSTKEEIAAARSVAKSGKYAILYGCSPDKLAETLDKPIRQAREIYDDYWQGNIGLKLLKERLTEEWKKYGYILAIDGRPLTVRYEHALINTLFQSCGSIAMKIALCWLTKQLNEKGYKYWYLGNFHDEIQLECMKEDAEEIGKLMVKSIQMAGRILKLNVPLTGEYQVALNWAETH